ncbi:MAG: HD domain-containing protein, partial [Acidobacteria bacterium]|nr:HD domain-containing protein [Acidobacteriota bacterium]
MVQERTTANRSKEQKIEEYLEEYRQKLGSQQRLYSGREAVDGIEDILEEFRKSSSQQAATVEQRQDTSETCLPDIISEEELNEFESRDFLKGKRDSPEGEAENETVEVYEGATLFVLESICEAEKDHLPDVERGIQLVQRIDELMSKNSSLLLAATNRLQEFAVSTHCVNVAILALRIAEKLDYSEKERIKVGLAALLHEIGVVKIARRVVHQRGEVGQEVRQRPVYSAEILKKLGSEYAWLVETVGQVYEREDGTGVPKGLKGEEIREEAKVLGLADVLEACIHERPYRRALTGYQMFHELTSGATRRFADRIVKAALKGFSLYPFNEYVLLNTGEIAKVIEVNPGNLLRPKIQMLYDSQGKPFKDERELDLVITPSRHITKAIT